MPTNLEAYMNRQRVKYNAMEKHDVDCTDCGEDQVLAHVPENGIYVCEDCRYGELE